MNRGERVKDSFATSARPARRSRRGTRRPGPVTVLTVPDAAMQAALDLANGDASRLDVAPDGRSVIVRNQPRR